MQVDLVLVHKSSFENIVTFAEATDPSNPYFGHESHGMEGDVVIYKKNGEPSTTPIIHRAILRLFQMKPILLHPMARVQMEEVSIPNGASMEHEALVFSRGMFQEPTLSIKAPSPSRLMASMQLTTIASVTCILELKPIWSSTNGRLSILDC